MAIQEPRHDALAGFSQRALYALAPKPAEVQPTALKRAGFVLLVGATLSVFVFLLWQMTPIGPGRYGWVVAGTVLFGFMVFLGLQPVMHGPTTWRQRLPIVCQALADHVGWHWSPAVGDSHTHAERTGRFTGTRVTGPLAGMDIRLDTTKARRELRIDLPLPDLEDFGTARDFADISDAQAVRERWQSAENYPKAAAILKGELCKILGRNRTLAVQDGTLVVTTKPYNEKSQNKYVQIRRRMREAEAVIYFTDAVEEDLRELLPQ